MSSDLSRAVLVRIVIYLKVVFQNLLMLNLRNTLIYSDASYFTGTPIRLFGIHVNYFDAF